MLSKNDLIFLGASLMLGGEAAKAGITSITDYDINNALDITKQVYSNIFDDSKEMILE